MNVPLLPTTGGDDTDMTFTTWEVALTRASATTSS
jgi:hypothetical protein